MIHELARRVITRFVEDVIREGGRRIAELDPRRVEDIRNADQAVIVFSPEIAAADADIMRFLWDRMYRHPGVVAVRKKADAIVNDLFAAFTAARPGCWRSGAPVSRRPAMHGSPAGSPTTSPE